MHDGAVLEAAIDSVLKPRGYRKRRSTWHLVLPEVILVANMQRSQWGPSFYINLGVYLRALGSETSPPEYRCHIRARAGTLLVNSADLDSALDLGSRLSAKQRSRIVEEFTAGYALPWLLARSSESAARASLGGDPAALVATDARRHLLGLEASCSEP